MRLVPVVTALCLLPPVVASGSDALAPEHGFATRGSFVVGGAVQLASIAAKMTPTGSPSEKSSALVVKVGPELSYFVAPGLALGLGVSFEFQGVEAGEGSEKYESSARRFGVSFGPSYYLQLGGPAWLSLGVAAWAKTGTEESRFSGSPSAETEHSETGLLGTVGLAVTVGSDAVVEVLGVVERATDTAPDDEGDEEMLKTTVGLGTRLGLVF